MRTALSLARRPAGPKKAGERSVAPRHGTARRGAAGAVPQHGRRRRRLRDGPRSGRGRPDSTAPPGRKSFLIVSPAAETKGHTYNKEDAEIAQRDGGLSLIRNSAGCLRNHVCD